VRVNSHSKAASVGGGLCFADRCAIRHRQWMLGCLRSRSRTRDLGLIVVSAKRFESALILRSAFNCRQRSHPSGSTVKSQTIALSSSRSAIQIVKF
jgi:hypothetical protein